MSSVFMQHKSASEHKPSMLYIRDYFDSWGGLNASALSVAYDLVLVNRQVSQGFFTQVYVEFAYAVTNPKDNFDRKVGRKIALENLEDGGQFKANYGSFFLGVGYDVSAVEEYESLGGKMELPKNAVPLRLLKDESPWILQKDMNLTGIVQEKALSHFISNTNYE